MLVSVSRVDKVEPAPPVTEEEELVDYEASPERINLEINIVHMSSDYLIIPEEEVAHLQFGPRDAVFQMPKESDNHLKALYMRGHLNGKADFSHVSGWWGYCKSYALLIV